MWIVHFKSNTSLFVHFICLRNWHWDEPSCGGEMCVVLYYQPSIPQDEDGHFLFRWNDHNCDSKNNFVCKYREGESVNPVAVGHSVLLHFCFSYDYRYIHFIYQGPVVKHEPSSVSDLSRDFYKLSCVNCLGQSVRNSYSCWNVVCFCPECYLSNIHECPSI